MVQLQCSVTEKARIGTPFLTITVCGFTATIGQIVILRELLVLFYGNELSTGLIFASWLLWTAMGSGVAGHYGTRMTQSAVLLPTLLAMIALLLPVSVLWIRAARIIWAVPVGETIHPLLMLCISLSGTGLFCLASGVLFGLAWSSLAMTSGRGAGQPLTIYVGEALGAALGGLFFYFILLPRVSILNATLITSLMTLAGASVVLFLQYRRFMTRSGYPVALLAVFGIVAAGLAFSGTIDKSSRRWQWGPNLLAVRDTPFQNLALLAEAGQFSLFANGLLFFSTPDPQTAEYAVHPAMLQHQAPSKVLVIGGGVGGLLGEVLKHEGVVRIDYVEPDPEVIELAEEYLPGSATAALFDRRVHLFHADAGAFVREAESPYDMVIMQLGDPANAEMNRFYTEEFFGRITRLLEPDGIFSFAVTASTGMVGLSEAGLLQSIYSTLRTVFPEVLVI
ncbi:MAG TPA: hypothetical protein PKV86_03035, partial [Syntrophobacteraceae bacterium]|nr:hypothetical protein [Syntrophobacteraceae bacterium]